MAATHRGLAGLVCQEHPYLEASGDRAGFPKAGISVAMAMLGERTRRDIASLNATAKATLTELFCWSTAPPERRLITQIGVDFGSLPRTGHWAGRALLRELYFSRYRGAESLACLEGFWRFDGRAGKADIEHAEEGESRGGSMTQAPDSEELWRGLERDGFVMLPDHPPALSLEASRSWR